MSDKVQLIKEEIERRIKNLEFSLENNCVEKHSKLDILGNITTLESLLQFINSLPEEPASEDLDREIGYYTTSKLLKKRDHSTGVYHLTQKDCDDIARHFAEWQKQQMMKDAVEGRVQCGYGDGNKLSIKAMLPQNSDLKYADKVKVLILKTE